MKRVAGLVAVVLFGLGSSGCSSSTGGEGSAPPGPPDDGTPKNDGPTTHASGELTAWNKLGSLPVARGNHCSVVANGWLVVIGGNYKPKGAKDFVTLADVHAAKLGADGSVGEWKLAGKTKNPVSSCTAAADGKDVYILDGIYDIKNADANDPSAPRYVVAATLGDDGTLGEWRQMGALPKGVRVLYSNAAVVDGGIRAFYARLPDAGDGIALASAKVDGGSLGAWTSSTWLRGFRGHPQYALAKPQGAKGPAYVYALGGYSGGDSGNKVLADGAGAVLDAAGVPGTSFAVRALPKPTSFGQAIAVDDWVFVIGGKDEIMTGKGRADVLAAKVGDGGALGEWKVVASLPEGRTSHALAASGDFLYVTGGGFDAGGLDTAWSARVRFAP